jgi:ADP-ribosylglycohydrolase
VTDVIRAAVYGHLVGDAIGVPYEFRHDIEMVELRRHDTHNQPAGTWSEDGALMLVLLDSLISVGCNADDQGRRALAWWDDGAYTPDGDGAFDIGNATPRRSHGSVRASPPSRPEAPASATRATAASCASCRSR